METNESLAVIPSVDLPPMVWTEQAERLKSDALAMAELIGPVSNESAQAVAVSAQMQLRDVLSRAEAARVLYKKPYLARNKQIDADHRNWTRELDAELMRISAEIGTYQTAQRELVSHAAAAHNVRLTELEREREAAIAASNTDDQRAEIVERYARQVRDLGPMPAAPQAQGQRVTEGWDVTVVNPHLLASAHPMCVDIRPRMTEIKALLDAGVRVAGVVAKRVVASTVQLPPQRKAIEA